MSGPSRSCLVSVYGPGNVLAALSAVRWYGHLHGLGAPTHVVTIVHPPSGPGERTNSIAETVGRLIAAEGWPAPIVLDSEAATTLATPSPGLGAYRALWSRFRRLTGIEHVDEFYYAHDIASALPGLAMNAYPRAAHITFGDALGSTFNKAHRIALSRGATDEEARRVASAGGQSGRSASPGVKSLLRGLLYGAPHDYQATDAVLALPMDMTGDYLADKKLSVVPREVVLDVISRCREALPEVATFTQSTLSSTRGGLFLGVLENYSDAGMMKPAAELEMYEFDIRGVAPRGATIVLKPHPLAGAEMARTLSDRLARDYHAIVLPSELMRYPLEIWTDLLQHAQVITAWSYCILSLAYLYGRATVIPPELENVRRFFPEHSQSWLRRVDHVMRGQLANLETWRGDDVLWKGSL